MSSAACIVTELRSKAGMSRRALAQAAGVPTSTISRIEEGLSDATIGMLDRLAKAAGRELEISDRSAGPTIADLAAKATREDFDWLGARCVADWVYANPGRASAAIDDPPAPTGSIEFDNLLAGMAETIADDHGLARPGWCTATQPSVSPWEQSGTPAMKKKARSATPPRLAARNIWVGRSAIWRDR